MLDSFHKKITWIDFSPRTNVNSVGHYIPLHLAWMKDAQKDNLDWNLVPGVSKSFNFPEFPNLVGWPSHFSIKDLIKMKRIIERTSGSDINFLVYEGDYVTFLFTLFLTKMTKIKFQIFFNWANHNQLFNNCNNVFFKYYMNIFWQISKDTTIHFVENPELASLLNQKSRLHFNRFPTTCVFDSDFDRYRNSKTQRKISLFLNDNSYSIEQLKLMITNLDRAVTGYEINIYSYRKFQMSRSKRNRLFFHFNQLDTKDYFKQLSGTELSIFVYNFENYRYLTSGRFFDSLYVGAISCIHGNRKTLHWLRSEYGNLADIDLMSNNLKLQLAKLRKRAYVNPMNGFTPKNLINEINRFRFRFEENSNSRLKLKKIMFFYLLLFTYTVCRFTALLTKRKILRILKKI